MRKTFLLFFGLLFILSCEDLIELELNDTNEILVVEAYINWIKERKTSEQEVRLSLSSPYFKSTYKPANGAIVTIEDEQGLVYKFVEQGVSGRYLSKDTIPYIINKAFTLKIDYQGQKYIGTEKLMSVSSINRIEQESVNFFGQERVQLEAYSVDPPEERNFSYFEFISDSFNAPQYNIYRDDFNNGGEYYGFLLVNDELASGDQIRVRQYALSNFSYNFWYLLIFQNTQQGGPFQATPVNLIGNMVHESNPNLNPLGYFRMSEVSEFNYTIK